MKEPKQRNDILHIFTRKEWRNWLRNNHDKTKKLWLIYYKKHTGKPRILYNDAVEEALCMDGLMEKSKEYYDSLAPTYKKQFHWWIVTAKRKETKEKRIIEAMKLLKANKKLSM
jgi:uncharacterized protein YdeI (YjbR/CyaY-like superfamily)